MGKMLFEGIWLSIMGILDARYRRIPFWLLGMGIPVAAAIAVRELLGGDLEMAEFLAPLIPGIVLLLAGVAKKAGYGDGMVLLLLGVMNIRGEIMRIFLMSLFFMSLFAVVMLVLRKVKRETRLPYLPFLTLAWFIGRVFL